MDITEQIYMSTVQIHSIGKSGNSISTSFFFQYKDITTKPCTVMVANKHAIIGYEQCILKMRSRTDKNIINVNMPISDWIVHSTYDLAILPMGRVYSRHPKLNIFQMSFDEHHIIPDERINEISCIEEVFMIGYPDGVIDSHNNLPIARNGITATPFKYDYKGKHEFLIDISVYGGSSGSPIFVLRNRPTVDNGKLISNPQLIFLGINRAVHLHTLSNTNELRLSIPNGLGIAVKSKILYDFIPKLNELIQNADNHNPDTGK